MSIVMNSPVLRDLTATPEVPYDGTESIRSDRKGGWKVNHIFLNKWIIAIPSRILADQFYEAIQESAEAAYACGFEDGKRKENE